MRYLQEIAKRFGSGEHFWGYALYYHNRSDFPVAHVRDIDLYVTTVSVRSASRRFNLVGVKIDINVDIDFPRLPCEIISVDVQDILGTHIVDFEGTLVKNVIDRNRKIVETMALHGQKYNSMQLVQKTAQSLDTGLG